MKKRALLAFDDPGGGLAVCSLIDELKKNDFSLEIYAGKLSERIVKFITSNYYNIESEITRKDADRIIDKFMPHIIITGTGGGNAEQLLRNSAREKKIRSVVILDFWKDYARRWKYADYPLSMMKDKVCVMDESVKDEMTAEGFPSENLFVTGHPYLDKIFSQEKKSGEEAAQTEQQVNVLFLSQPLKILGVTEYSVHPLKVFLSGALLNSRRSGRKFRITVKLHPSEMQTEEMNAIANEFQSDDFCVEFALPGSNINELIDANDITAGYKTIAMFEARAAGKKTLSIDIGKTNPSLMKTMMDSGIEIVKCEESEIEKMLESRKQKDIPADLFKGGISNCIGVIMNQFNLV